MIRLRVRPPHLRGWPSTEPARRRGKRPAAVFHPEPGPVPPPITAPADAIKRDFAARLQQHMTRKGWNQSELARQAALHMPSGKMGRDSVSGYLRCRNMPNAAARVAIAKALGVCPEDLGGIVRPSASGTDAPALLITQTAEGSVWLQVNQTVSKAVALEIQRLLANGGTSAF